MTKILIIGGGAMGSAFSIPCLENKNKVTITEPYSKVFKKNLSSKNKFHSALKIKLSKKLRYKKFSQELLLARLLCVKAMVLALCLQVSRRFGPCPSSDRSARTQRERAACR